MLTIAIPSYNRCVRLTRLLESLHQPLVEALLENGQRYEVVVVLDGSLDDSQDMLESMQGDFPCTLRSVWQPNAGRAAARNRLIECAEGERVWFLDDDMTVSKAALKIHSVTPLQPNEILMGPSHVLGSEGLRLFYATRWEELAELGVCESAEQVSFANTSASLALMQQFLFDSTFKRYGFEDYDLAIRLMAAGTRILFNPQAEVWHHYNRGPFQMLRNIRDEGFNRVKLIEKFPTEAEFALQFPRRRYRQWLTRVGNNGWDLPLWIAANIVRGAALLSQRLLLRDKEPELDSRLFKIVRLANDLALHSGVAKAGGKISFESMVESVC